MIRAILPTATTEGDDPIAPGGGDYEVRWLLQSLKPDEWLHAIDYWTAWLIASGIRPRTIELRRYQIGHLAEAHLNRSPWSLTTRDLMLWLAGQDWAPETRKSYRSALRSFYGWGLQAGETRRNPTAALPAVRTVAPPPRPTPDRVLADALAVVTDRDRLILVLAAYAGLRRSEIARLRWSDVSLMESNSVGTASKPQLRVDDSELATIRVHGKGGKVRTVPMHPLVRAELLAEHTRRQDGRYGTGYRFGTGCRCGCVFPGQSGDGPMTPGAVGLAASRALGPGWTGHTLRHRFASRAYRGSHDLLAVQALMGHSKPETTKRYTELDGDALTAAIRTV